MHVTRNVHYIICLDFKFHELYIVWIDGEDADDGVLVDVYFNIIAFKTKEALMEYWRKHIKEENPEQTKYSFYKLQQWLLHPHPEFDGDEFLNYWNLFIDFAESTKKEFIGDIKGDIRDSVYNKLFDASGLFIVKNPNPVFEADEINMLSKVMQNGVNLLLNNMVIIENEKILP